MNHPMAKTLELRLTLLPSNSRHVRVNRIHDQLDRRLLAKLVALKRQSNVHYNARHELACGDDAFKDEPESSGRNKTEKQVSKSSRFLFSFFLSSKQQLCSSFSIFMISIHDIVCVCVLVSCYGKCLWKQSKWIRKDFSSR